MKKIILVLLVMIFSAEGAFARSMRKELSLEDVTSWKEFDQAMLEQESVDRTDGMAYMISGALLLAGGLVGYHNAGGNVEKLAYSVSQSLGVAGLGYGYYLYHVGTETRSFYESVRNTSGLSETNRNDLTRNYVKQWKVQQENEKWMKIATYALVGGLNLYNASRESGDLRQGLTILGGVNLLAAISLTF